LQTKHVKRSLKGSKYVDSVKCFRQTIFTDFSFSGAPCNNYGFFYVGHCCVRLVSNLH